jgi:hypothetical protein
MADFSAWDLARAISGVADLGLQPGEEFRTWLMKAVYTHLRTIEEKGAVDFALAKLQQGDRSMRFDPRWAWPGAGALPAWARPGCPWRLPPRWQPAARCLRRGWGPGVHAGQPPPPPPATCACALPAGQQGRPRAAPRTARRWTHEELGWLPGHERDKRRIIKDGWFKTKWAGWAPGGGA